ncbi:hypothetical protein AVEN_130192-1 [Araneus ventricosus]|uniref:Uncharacterized protein n=1 Tax=Araneus ventricosus TaxID=182803 RepID=A0A4Y2XBY2_ARAVE|nr:hypothetical protein AVEN_130192-1 [Araneus ventricosus]
MVGAPHWNRRQGVLSWLCSYSVFGNELPVMQAGGKLWLQSLPAMVNLSYKNWLQACFTLAHFTDKFCRKLADLQQVCCKFAAKPKLLSGNSFII